MPEDFRRFVIFAGMRTGSNLLESTLNRIKRVTCFGEAFNPYMLGWPEKTELQGITKAERDAEPLKLLQRLFERPNHLSGFRYFHDHDPRVFDAIIADRHCAKIILSRNVLDSYVSTRLAWATNQWKLNETETPVPASITFDSAEFRSFAADMDQFQHRIVRALQLSGQTAFWLGYDDLRDSEVMTGLLHWLGRTDLDRVDPAHDQVPQNPREMADKVDNIDVMTRAIQDMDPFGTGRVPTFENRRGPAVPSFVASDAGRGLLFMPVKGGPTESLSRWLGNRGTLTQNFTQKTLREWQRGHPGHRSFTVLRHPLYRAWEAFAAVIAAGNPELRQVLRDAHRVALPPDEALATMPDRQQSKLFGQFLDFLRRNLNGQTSLPTRPAWASQIEVVQGFARFAPPDAILREDQIDRDLDWIAGGLDLPATASGEVPKPVWPEFLHDPAHVAAARAAYLRDYIAFGFDDPA